MTLDPKDILENAASEIGRALSVATTSAYKIGLKEPVYFEFGKDLVGVTSGRTTEDGAAICFGHLDKPGEVKAFKKDDLLTPEEIDAKVVLTFPNIESLDILAKHIEECRQIFRNLEKSE